MQTTETLLVWSSKSVSVSRLYLHSRCLMLHVNSCTLVVNNHLFLPLVSIFGLFPVLVSCHYELSMFQLCLCDICYLPCVFSSCLLSLISSGLLVTSPVYPVSESCLVLPWCLIKDYYLSLCPRLRVPVPPSCVHRDRRPDHNRKRRPFTSFCFHFQKSFVLFQSVCLCLSRGKEVAARNPAIAHCKTAWEFGGIAASAASPLAAMPSCPPIAGDIRRRWLSQARRRVA